MYLITDYEERYKPYDKSGNDLKRADWVKLPAKPKGDGLQVLLEYPRGLEIFAVWCLLLEKTTLEKNPKNRGKLLNHKGQPASIYEIAKSISLPRQSKLVEHSLSALLEMGWITSDGKTETTSADFPKTSPKSRVEKSRVEKSIIYCHNSVEFRLSSLLLDLILQRKADYQQSKIDTEKKKNQYLQKWAVHIDRLIRLDNRTPDRIEEVIRWSQQDDFWQNNILATEKLRKQIDKLELGMKKKKPETFEQRVKRLSNDG
jgi:hypothetical protein